MSRKLIVELIGDTSNLDRALKRSSKNAETFSAKLTSSTRAFGRTAAATAAGFIGAQGIEQAIHTTVGAVGGMIDAASDLNEQMNRNQVLFKQSAGTVADWSKTTADAIGISSREALQAAGNFGAMFETSGLASSAAAQMSTRMVQLAADMASFNNVDPSDMLDRIRSGLAGEAEPLRRYGVLLSEARVKQEAYRSGLAQQGATLTEQQKVQARYALILQDTARQQGDFARTSDSLANVQRRLRAQVDDVAASMGQALLPVVTQVATKMNEWLADPENRKALQNFTRDVATLTVKLGELAGSIVKAGVAVHDWATGIRRDVDPVNKVLDKFLRAHGLGALAQGPPPRPVGDFGPGRKVTGGGGDFAASAAEQAADTTKAVAATKKARDAATKLVKQRNEWFDAMVGRREDRVQDIQSLQGQVVEYRAIEKLIQDRINVTKDITRQLHLEDELAQFRRERRGVEQEIAANARQRAEAAKEAAAAAAEALRQRQAQQRALRLDRLGFAAERAAVTETITDDIAALRAQNAELKKQMREQGVTLAARRQVFQNNQEILRLQREDAQQKREAAVAARTARQFRQLGLGPTGEALVPLGATLLKRVGRIQDAIRGTVLDTAEHRKMLANIRSVLVKGLGDLAPEVRQKVAELLDALTPTDDQKKKADPVNWIKIGGIKERLAPMGTEAWIRQAIRAGVSTTPIPVAAGMNVGTMNVHLHGVQNVPQFETELEKRAMQRPKPRRGA